MEYGGFETMASNGSSSQCLGSTKSIAVFNTEFIVTDVMQEHINTAKVVGGDVDFLTEKSIANIIFTEDFRKFQKQ